jgi:hypothetical protein
VQAAEAKGTPLSPALLDGAVSVAGKRAVEADADRARRDLGQLESVRVSGLTPLETLRS